MTHVTYKICYILINTYMQYFKRIVKMITHSLWLFLATRVLADEIDPIGRVDTIEGTVHVLRNGERIILNKDDPILQGDTILTSEEDIEELDDYTDLTAPTATGPETITAETGTAEEGTRAADTVATTVDAAIAEDLAPIEAAQGDRPDAAVVDDATLTERAVAAERDPRQEEAALARDQEFIMDKRSMIDPVTGEKIDVSSTPDAEAKARKAITGEEAPDGVEAVIRDTVGYEAAQRRKVKGTAAKSEAAGMIEQLGDLPPDITASIVENPATVAAELDEQPVEVRAAVAALPTEALVSSQMEALLADMDAGQTPAWARPAVAAIEQRLAQRGLSASTVG